MIKIPGGDTIVKKVDELKDLIHFCKKNQEILDFYEKEKEILNVFREF